MRHSTVGSLKTQQPTPIIPHRRRCAEHRKIPRGSPSHRKRFLPLITPADLAQFWRTLSDLPEHASVGGFPASLISLFGYKVAVSGSTCPVKTSRHSIIIPVRNLDGVIVALHGVNGRWFTARQPHFVNVARARWTGEIEIHSDTVTADVESARRNVACVALNGLTHHDLELATVQLRVRLVKARTWGVAA